MTEKIPPALSPEEWAEPANVGYFDWPNGIVDVSSDTPPDRLPAQIIALANAALPDSDARKITREKIKMLRDYAADITRIGGGRHGGELDHLADELEAYLPPKSPLDK